MTWQAKDLAGVKNKKVQGDLADGYLPGLAGQLVRELAGIPPNKCCLACEHSDGHVMPACSKSFKVRAAHKWTWRRIGLSVIDKAAHKSFWRRSALLSPLRQGNVGGEWGVDKNGVGVCVVRRKRLTCQK